MAVESSKPALPDVPATLAPPSDISSSTALALMSGIPSSSSCASYVRAVYLAADLFFSYS
jgi:hypothetical protein